MDNAGQWTGGMLWTNPALKDGTRSVGLVSRVT